MSQPAVQVRFADRRSAISLAAFAVLLVVLAAAPAWAGRDDLRLLGEIYAYVALASLWNLLAGYAGLVSVGQQAYVGLGGYMLFGLTILAGISPLWAIPAAGLIGALASVPVAALVFRLRGHYFAIGTWVVAEVFRLLASQASALGGGSGTSLPAAIVIAIAPTRAMREFVVYWIALALAVAILGLILWLLRSRYGLALTAIRDNELAASSNGVDVGRVKLVVYVFTACGTAMVGALIFLQKLRISPDAAFNVNDWTAFVIFITVIGGIGRLEGPIVGTIVFFALRQTLADRGALYLMMLGAVAIAVMLKAPKGIWGLVAARLDWQIFPLQRRVVRLLGSSIRKRRSDMNPPVRKTPSIAIDIHAHMMVPEVYAVTVGHSAFGKSVSDPSLSPEAAKKARERSDFVVAKMSDAAERIGEMDKMGVDIQVLSASLVHQCTYWAEPEESLRLERKLNDRVGEMVASNPKRLIGLGTVPLHAPALAAREAERCMSELKLAGFNISTAARDMEIGDRQLWPFWEKAAEHGAVVYIHPAGNPSPRFQKHFLWNSVGQNFEESMAIASLMYEGVLETFPQIKICISHGGGYMPLCMGRVSRNYLEKPTTRANMKKSPDEYLRQLYYDSCVYDHDVLRHLVERVGASQVILGSDYPVGEWKPIEFVRETPGLSEADQNKIIGLNAARMFGVAVPA